MLAFAAAVLIVLVLYFLPVLSGAKTLYWADHTYFFEPLCRFIGNSFARGHFPLWNPLIGCGQSQVALPSPNPFYPTTWMFAVLPYSPAVAVQFILHQIILAVGAFLLVGELGWGIWPAVAAGSLLGLNGYVFSSQANWTLILTGAWLPSMFFILLWAEKQSSRRKVAVISMAIMTCLTLLGGRPEIWVLSLASISIFVIYRYLVILKQPRFAILMVAALCSGLLLAMPSLLPAYEWSRLSPRNVEGMHNPLLWSANWYDFFSILFGLPLGSIEQFRNPLSKIYEDVAGFVPLIGTAFFGPVAASLSLFALFDRTFKQRFLLAFLFVVICGLSAGAHVPHFRSLLKALPLVSLLRYPIKLQFFLEVIVALLSARGVFALLNRNTSKLVIYSVVSLWAILCVMGGALMLHPDFSWFGVHQYFIQLVGDKADGALRLMGQSMASFSVVGVVASVLSLVVLREKEATRQVSATQLLVLLMVGTLLFIACTRCRFLAPADYFSSSAVAADAINEMHKESGPARFVFVKAQDATIVPRTFHAPGEQLKFYDTMIFMRQVLNENQALDYGVSSLIPYEGSVTKAIAVLAWNVVRTNSQIGSDPSDEFLARACQTTGTNFASSLSFEIAGKKPPVLNRQYFELVKEIDFLRIRLYRTLNALPYSYFISKYHLVDQRNSAINALADPHEKTFDPHQSVMLTPFENGDIALPATDSASATVLRSIVSTSPDPEHIHLKVEAPTSGIVVVNDNIYPGWKAKLDGKPARLWCANATFKAVAVTAGNHDVDFSFEPESLIYGFVGSFVGLMLVVLLAVLVRNDDQSG